MEVNIFNTKVNTQKMRRKKKKQKFSGVYSEGFISQWFKKYKQSLTTSALNCKGVLEMPTDLLLP